VLRPTHDYNDARIVFEPKAKKNAQKFRRAYSLPSLVALGVLFSFRHHSLSNEKSIVVHTNREERRFVVL
jgi:hypothetical protein